jgi:hypothetical protein
MRKRMRRSGGWYLLLHLDRAANRAIDAVERNQQGIAAGLHHAATVLADCRVDQRAPHCAQAAQCAGVVQANQSAVTHHVGINDRDQLAAARSFAGEVTTDTSRAHDRDDSITAGRRDNLGAEPGAETLGLNGQSLSD